MRKKIVLVLMMMGFATIGSAQAPYLINYQAVAHDATGALLTTQPVTVTFGIYQGSASGTLVWEEEHASLTTNDYGLFYTKIGAGSSTGSGTLGSFSAIGWGIDTYYLKTQIDAGSGPQDLGTVQFVSVPYALNAGSTGAINNQAVTSAGAADGNILIFNGTSGAWEAVPPSSLYSAGAGIDITSGVISNTGDVDETDDHITAFDLNATSDSLYIQDGNGRYVVALSDINSPGIDADGDGWPANLDLDDSDVTVTFHDADDDSTNELNTGFGLNVAGDSLVLTDNGGSLAVPLSDFSDGDWTVSGTDVYNTTGNIGIGTATPNYPLELTATAQRGAYIEIDGFSSSSTKIGVTGVATNGAGSGDNVGGSFNALGGTGGNNIGVKGISSGGVGINYGIFAQATGGSLGNYAGYFSQGDVYIADNLGIGTTNATEKLHVFGGSITIDDGANPYTFPASDGASNMILMTDGTGGLSWTVLPASTNLYISDGTLSGNRVVNQGANTLSFTGTATNGFSVDGTTFSVDAANNRVGIGTSAPTVELDVAGSTTVGSNLLVQGVTSTVGTLNADGDMNFGNGASDQIDFIGTIKDQNAMVFDGATGGGFTTTLEVTDPTANNVVTLQDGTGTLAFLSDISGPGGIYSGSGSLSGATAVTQGGNALDFTGGNFSVDGPTFFVDEANALVGIGTNTPAAQLEVEANNTARASQFIQNTASSSDKYGIYSLAGSGGSGENIGVQGEAAFATTNKAIVGRAFGGTSNWAGFFEAGNVYIQNNLAIGTSTPSEKLHILGGSITIDDGANPYTLPAADGTADQVMLTDGAGVVTWQTPPASPAWDLLGNAGTTAGTNFIGTTDAEDLDIRTNNVVTHRFTQQKQIEFLNSGRSVFIGESAGEVDDLSDNENVFIGYQTGFMNTSGFANLGVGAYSLFNNTTGYNNSAMGFEALYTNAVGNANTAVGAGALRVNTASGNSAFGSGALRLNSTGASNTAVGSDALYSNTTGNDNTGMGEQVLYSNLTGTRNSAYGYRSAYSNQDGSNNTSMGYEALLTNTAGDYNVAVGYSALRNTTTSGNTAIGTFALNANNTGANNVAVGSSALLSNTTGSINVAVGVGSLQNNLTGIRNVASGVWSLQNTTGSSNVGIGDAAGFDNTSGSNNTFIGANADATDPALTNATAIGSGAQVGSSNSLVLGNNADVGIGTSTPNAKLHVAGDGSLLGGLRVGATTSATVGAAIYLDGAAQDWTIVATNSSATPGANKLVFRDYTNATDRMVIQNDGTVGIGTTTPAAKLDVEGDVQIDDEYTYETAKTRVMSINAKAFTEDRSPDSYYNSNSNAIYSYFESGGPLNKKVHSGLNLPDGAVITDVTGYVYMNGGSPSSIVPTIELISVNMGAGTSVIEGSATSSVDSPSIQPIDFAPGTVIDNSTNSYYLKYTQLSTFGLGGSDRFYGMKITYTVMQAE